MSNEIATTDDPSTNTLEVPEELDEEKFFTTENGDRTLVTHDDLEQEVTDEFKPHFREVERYWVNKPYAFVVLYHSRRENEMRYYAIQPDLTDVERDLVDFLRKKLTLSIDYEKVPADATARERAQVIRKEAATLLKRYNLVQKSSDIADDTLASRIGSFVTNLLERQADKQAEKVEKESKEATENRNTNAGAAPRPIDEDGNITRLGDRQVEKLMYYLVRDFIGYERIDPLKHDINVEDISCDGYNSNVFAYHTEYEQLITNIRHGEQDLDEFVIKLAQQAGKGISKRQPNVDCTLPDGSRAQLTLGQEVSDHGTNYTIRQFKDIPYTPIDLINWNTFAIDQMVYLWLCIENNRSTVFAGGTASGKTTSLNAVTLFIPSNKKIVSIEDTREIELPQKNWIASVTRQSFTSGGDDAIDEFDLLEDALRQRPDYIIMGEVRGEEGRTLFQAMNTGHTTYTTFHADSVGEVIKRFTTDPINVTKSMFSALDVVCNQEAVQVDGHMARRNTAITEIDTYEPTTDEFTVDKAFEWLPKEDRFKRHGRSELLAEIQHANGWSDDELELEKFKRKVVLAYMVRKGVKTYSGVAATLQGFINDDETILAMIAQDKLDENLNNLEDLKSVDISISAEQEALVPRPDPDSELFDYCGEILDEAEMTLFPEYEDLNVALTESLDEEELEDEEEEEEEISEDELDELLDSVESLGDDDPEGEPEIREDGFNPEDEDDNQLDEFTEENEHSSPETDKDYDDSAPVEEANNVKRFVDDGQCIAEHDDDQRCENDAEPDDLFCPDHTEDDEIASEATRDGGTDE